MYIQYDIIIFSLLLLLLLLVVVVSEQKHYYRSAITRASLDLVQANTGSGGLVKQSM